MSLQLLKDILVHRRAHSSIDEQNFLEWYRPFLAQYCDIPEGEMVFHPCEFFHEV